MRLSPGAGPGILGPLEPLRGRGAQPGAGGGRWHPGSASWRGGAERSGARPGKEETRAGVAQLRETLSGPAVRAPAAWRGLEVKGGRCRGEGALLALSQAELWRNRLAFLGKGGEEMLTPLLGASSFWSPPVLWKSGFSPWREPICG